MSWLADTLGAATAKMMTYTRGLESITIPISPVPGQASRSAIADGRVNFEVRGMDFDIDPADIVFGAVQVDPQKGDRITYRGNVYGATDRDGEPVFLALELDAYGNKIRVRTTLEA